MLAAEPSFDDLELRFLDLATLNVTSIPKAFVAPLVPDTLNR